MPDDRIEQRIGKIHYPTIRHSIRFMRLCIMPIRRTIRLSSILSGLSVYATFYLVYPALTIAHVSY